MPAPKSVAIIGAGPSGLVTAKYMLAAGLVPTVFDKRPDVGGLWAAPLDGAVSLKPAMKTNASNYTASFSDKPWERSGRGRFPTVVEVGRYLADYAREHLREECFKLGCEVTGVQKLDESGGWKVKWRGKQGDEEGGFEFLVIASGFFAKPYRPDFGDLEAVKGSAVHSGDYTFGKVYSPDAPGKQKIVIVGGSLSASEEAGDVALRVSSLPKEQQEKVEIVHIFTKPPHVIPKQLPLANPQDEAAPRFLPADLVFYDTTRFEKPQPAPIPAEDVYRGLHTILKNTLGGSTEANVVAEELRIREEDMPIPPTVTISDGYTGFVRSGCIKTMLGRVSKIAGTTVVLESPSEVREVRDVTAVIFCTGYTTALKSFISDALLPVSDVKVNYPLTAFSSLPLQLYKNTLSSHLGRNAGYVGFFTRPGPFWGSLELQARWLAGLFAGSVPWPSEDELATDREKLMKVAETGGPVALQRELGEYLEWVLDLGVQSGVSTFSAVHKERMAPKTYIPAFMPPVSEHAVRVIEAFRADISAPASKNRFIKDAIFRALHGSWHVDRVLTSNPRFMASGTFKGSCTFRPRLQTFSYDPATWEILPELDEAQNATPGGEVTEYLYTEEGVFTFDHGANMAGRMKYIYRWDPQSGQISSWYVKPGEEEVSHFFHEVEVMGTEEDVGLEGAGWKARGTGHLCGEDWYEPRYRFAFEGAELACVDVSYNVTGPKKDYKVTSELVRGIRQDQIL